MQKYIMHEHIVRIAAWNPMGINRSNTATFGVCPKLVPMFQLAEFVVIFSLFSMTWD